MVMWTGLALAAIPWLIVFRARFGAPTSLALVTLGAPATLVALMMVAYMTGSPLVTSIVTVVAVLGGFGWLLVLRSWSTWRRRGFAAVPDVATWRDAAPAGLGAVIALGAFVCVPLSPSASRVSWAMLGDSASQLMYARHIMAEGGVAPPPLANPVPLSPAMVAAVAAPGRPATGASAIVSHDIGAYASTWAALIVVSCLLAGAIAYAMVRNSQALVGLPAKATVGAASMLPLGWFWTGYPVKFGFINAHLVFIILVASILAYLNTRSRPWLGMAMQVTAILLTLLTWTPLAILPTALLLIQAAGELRAFPRWSLSKRLATMAGGAALIVMALWRGLPVLLEASGSLSIPGGLAEFPKLMLPVTAIVLAVLTLAASARVDRVVTAMIALAGAGVAGLLVVLVLSDTLTRPWTYYPHKYAWIATTVLLTLALPQAALAVARVRPARLRGGLYGVGALAVAVSLGLGSWWAPGHLQFLRDSVPYVILVEDNLPNEGQHPDSVANAVIARVEAERLTIPWESSLANDYRAAFWLMHLQREEAMLRGDGHGANALWTLANFHGTTTDLCTLAGVVPEGLTVQTAHEGLSGELEALCPGADVIVATEAARDALEPR
ncbi:hypothetical protein LGT39_01050 [Demequina sp. TTPB684]|uniref:hypothetical protein n=1 Tax=unclassified Demequina TaxID=2620311 RepID=UPI001CF485F9|nr:MULTISPECIES: hypothetical protein [unclassified Demequina]MCB2411433.1 hypothetical protein [Demequina sp. TTPB684]UPU88275.1 hypothetical protein LGT36_013695 [Demequina sp. TMPB413]